MTLNYVVCLWHGGEAKAEQRFDDVEAALKFARTATIIPQVGCTVERVLNSADDRELIQNFGDFDV